MESKVIGAKSPQVENFLDRVGIKYRYEPAIEYGQIHVERGLKNNARILSKPIDEDTANKYSIAMKEGAVFPAIVLSKNGRGYNVHDGNNRLQAFNIAGLANPEATVGAYVIDCEDVALVAIVTRGINATNGLPPSQDELIAQAIAILESCPSYSQAKVAAAVGLSQNALSKALAARRVADDLRASGVRTDGFTKNALLELNRLSSDAPVMVRAAEVAAEANLPQKEITEMITIAKARRSEATKLEAVEQFAERFIKADKTPERKNSPKSRFLGCVNTLYTFAMKHPTLAHLHLTSRQEILEAKRDWERVREAVDAKFAEVK